MTPSQTLPGASSPPTLPADASRHVPSHHHRQFEVMGAQPGAGAGATTFTVWAPNARSVGVVGSFNGWQPQPLARLPDGSGRWSGSVNGTNPGDRYKYRIHGADGNWVDKADPYALRCEHPPGTASEVWDLAYDWGDSQWMAARGGRQSHASPMSIYEVHLGSWQRTDDGKFLNYRELAQRLAAHCEALGFTHVELMPVTEHPFYGSWGYQTTGYYAPTARYGTPQDLMAMVDTLHQRGIGVILDWVASHFPSDAFALARFDGTELYEHADPRLGFHPQWNSLIFNYGRYEVRDFLISNAVFWLEKYHFDGIRVDAVASMLYLDFAREPGQWLPNREGGNKNHEAVHFLQDLNRSVYAEFPDVHVMAEESTAWPGVTQPVHDAGLGFGMKWNMGWMNDTLRYVARPHFFRKWHGDDIRFSAVYAFNENFILPLSHDEVVYGKGSLLERQPGDEWQCFAGLRTLFGYMWTHPGKKLLFMGGEFAEPREWHHERTLDWQLWQLPAHAGVARWIADLNAAYRRVPALHRHDFDPSGFSWAPTQPPDPTVLAFFRRGAAAGGHGATIVSLCNMTPEIHHGFRIGLPHDGPWYELLNSDAAIYGGSGAGNFGQVLAVAEPLSGQPASALLTLPPLATLVLCDLPPDSFISSPREAPHALQP